MSVSNMRLRVLLVFCGLFLCVRSLLRTDAEYWTTLAKEELKEAINVELNYGTAKNVILFVGDGMGPNTVTAARIYKGGETHRLCFEKFPHMGLLKTYAANKMVPDSACSATALFCGIKANKDTMGVDATVKRKDCDASLSPTARPLCLAGLALKSGKSAGLVTTMRVTHATPGALYAHSADRSWECEAKMPIGTECKDIARQLTEDWPGMDLNVVMGGGMQGLMFNSSSSPEDPKDTYGCIRMDGRDLIKTYINDKTQRNLKYSIVRNNQELKSLKVKKTDYLLGIFANGHLSYEHERNQGPEGMPSLADMVKAAIRVLRKNKNGYFLMVEGGNIDMAHHRSWAKRAVTETAAMEAAVDLALNMTNSQDTLLIVTSDHTHTMAINGYPNRGSDIFGASERSYVDGINYTVLSYTTGGPLAYQYEVVSENNKSVVKRKDPTMDNQQKYDYVYQAGIQLTENVHGGGDVAIYASGPHAHLFHNVHEQHYVYHAIAYAAKMGNYDISNGIHWHAHTTLSTCVLVTTLHVLLWFYRGS